MSAEDLLAEVQRLKEVVLLNGFRKNQEESRSGSVFRRALDANFGHP